MINMLSFDITIMMRELGRLCVIKLELTST